MWTAAARARRMSVAQRRRMLLSSRSSSLNFIRSSQTFPSVELLCCPSTQRRLRHAVGLACLQAVGNRLYGTRSLGWYHYHAFKSLIGVGSGQTVPLASYPRFL
jgi:hypothetical protein